MNERNVAALKAACEGLPLYYGSDFREMAEYLASRGVLGPASEVLTDPLCVPLPGGQVMEFYAPGIDLVLERIAKGET